MNQFNEKGLKHGPWETYWDNGNLMYKINYVNGKKHGLYDYYHPNGKLTIKSYYI